MNSVCLCGRMTKDPDYRQNGESSVVRFSVAVDRKFKNAEGKYEADFINCVAFSKTADFISKYFSKGMRIGVTGRIQTGSYTNRDGQKVYTTDVVVDTAEFIESKNTQTAQPQNNNQGFDVNAGIDNSSDLDDLPFN